MIFEVGKYYRHPTNKELHIIGEVTESDLFFNPSLVAENLYGDVSLVGVDEDSSVNFVECEPWVIKDGGVHSAQDVKA